MKIFILLFLPYEVESKFRYPLYNMVYSWGGQTFFPRAKFEDSLFGEGLKILKICVAEKFVGYLFHF
jgi:hypothetical protein